MKLVQKLEFDMSQFHFYKTHRTRPNGPWVYALIKEHNGVSFIRIGGVKVIGIVL